MPETPRNIESRMDRVEDALSDAGDDYETMTAPELYMATLRAVHEQRPGDAERAWNEYERRLAAACEGDQEAP